jgi:hypothetical protein
LRADGQPIFSAEQMAGSDVAVFKAKVTNFEYLYKFLQVANEQKLIELQAIIQVCRNPVQHVFGITGENGKALVEAFDSFNNEVDPRKKEQYSKLYKLLLVLNSFDLQLMTTAVKSASKFSVLDLAKVTEELEMLAAFCGRDPANALIKIDWELDYTF